MSQKIPKLTAMDKELLRLVNRCVQLGTSTGISIGQMTAEDKEAYRKLGFMNPEVFDLAYSIQNKDLHKIFLGATPGLFYFMEIDGIPHLRLSLAAQILTEWVV